MIATSRAAYCRLCWAAAELVLTCTASRALQDRIVTFTAEAILRLLGVPADEAARLAALPIADAGNW